jgi:hypothetical protein
MTYTIFDGDVSENYKSLKAIIQVVDKEHGGGIVKWTYEYEKLKEDISYHLSPELILDFHYKKSFYLRQIVYGGFSTTVVAVLVF